MKHEDRSGGRMDGWLRRGVVGVGVIALGAALLAPTRAEACSAPACAYDLGSFLPAADGARFTAPIPSNVPGILWKRNAGVDVFCGDDLDLEDVAWVEAPAAALFRVGSGGEETQVTTTSTETDGGTLLAPTGGFEAGTYRLRVTARVAADSETWVHGAMEDGTYTAEHTFTFGDAHSVPTDFAEAPSAATPREGDFITEYNPGCHDVGPGVAVDVAVLVSAWNGWERAADVTVKVDGEVYTGPPVGVDNELAPPLEDNDFQGDDTNRFTSVLSTLCDEAADHPGLEAGLHEVRFEARLLGSESTIVSEGLELSVRCGDPEDGGDGENSGDKVASSGSGCAVAGMGRGAALAPCGAWLLAALLLGRRKRS